MCGRHKQRESDTVTDISYEGETTRLQHNGIAAKQAKCSGYKAFPWWTLWLLWPVISLGKGLFGVASTGWTALGEWMVPANVLLALALCAIGLVLLIRQRTQ